MSLSPRMSKGRAGLKSFRLSDVPLTIRLDAKEDLLFGNGSKDGVVPVINSPTLRMEIGLAADLPSMQVYWISERAWERVMNPAPEPETKERKRKKAA